MSNSASISRQRQIIWTNEGNLNEWQPAVPSCYWLPSRHLSFLPKAQLALISISPRLHTLLSTFSVYDVFDRNEAEDHLTVAIKLQFEALFENQTHYRRWIWDFFRSVVKGGVRLCLRVSSCRRQNVSLFTSLTHVSLSVCVFASKALQRQVLLLRGFGREEHHE